METAASPASGKHGASLRHIVIESPQRDNGHRAPVTCHHCRTLSKLSLPTTAVLTSYHETASTAKNDAHNHVLPELVDRLRGVGEGVGTPRIRTLTLLVSAHNLEELHTSQHALTRCGDNGRAAAAAAAATDDAIPLTSRLHQLHGITSTPC